MNVWTHAVVGVLYACVLHFYICTFSAQFGTFHMERRSGNTLIVIKRVHLIAEIMATTSTVPLAC